MLPHTDPIEVEHTNIHEYQLVRDRQKRAVKPPEKYGYADMISFYLTVASEIDEN